MCVLVYVICGCTRKCLRVCLWSVYVYRGMFVWVHVFDCVLWHFGPIWWDPTRLRKTRTRFGLVLVMDLIQWRFKNWFMGWSIDQYRFMMWRPEGDLVPKPRHFMWVFVLEYFFIYCCRYVLTCYSYHFMWLSIIFYQFYYFYHFIRHL